jgi:hypothetical protein
MDDIVVEHRDTLSERMDQVRNEFEKTHTKLMVASISWQEQTTKF